MHRRSFLSLPVLPLLYVSGAARAADAVPAPKVALVAAILPLKSPGAARQAGALAEGMHEAARAAGDTSPGLNVIATGDEPAEALAAYARAVREGARVVVGPPGRRAVTALAQLHPLPVPLIALNLPEREGALAADFRTFGRQIEQEVRQVADLAAAQGRRRCRVLHAEGGLSRRLAQAFAERWAQGGGDPVERLVYTEDPVALVRLRERLEAAPGEAIFLALDDEQARRAAPFLHAAGTPYATSLAFGSDEALANFELEGLVFVDMPWLLQPDHPAVLAYRRPASPYPPELQRFYAMGVDALRLAMEHIDPDGDPDGLDGVTGAIRLEQEHHYMRTLLPARMSQGAPQVLAGPPAAGRP